MKFIINNAFLTPSALQGTIALEKNVRKTWHEFVVWDEMKCHCLNFSKFLPSFVVMHVLDKYLSYKMVVLISRYSMLICDL